MPRAPDCRRRTIVQLTGQGDVVSTFDEVHDLAIEEQLDVAIGH